MLLSLGRKTMLYIIGLGLGDASDITVKGLEALKKCNKVFLESYTSILTVGQDALEIYYGKNLIIADREMVEQDSDQILGDAKTEDVAFLVVGDPFGATTHTDLILRARQAGIPYRVIHNASIMNAVACCGLQLYSFGETVSIPYWTDTWKPDSFFDKILMNRKNKLHTLCLLDIKVREPTIESLTRKRKEYMPPKFMSICEAVNQILEIIMKRNMSNDTSIDKSSITEDTQCIGLARVGTESQHIVYCSLNKIGEIDFGGPLHSLVIPGDIQPMELEFLTSFSS